MFDFQDRVAIVTGAGGGLGRAHALLLAARGAAVVVNDLGGARDGTGEGKNAADSVVAEIKEAGGAAAADYNSVATSEGGAAIVQTALDEFGRVDILVNNAGILRDVTLANMEWEALEAVLAVHLKGAFHVTQPAFRYMKEHGYGRIILTASNAGLLGNFGQTNYGAAKMGLVGFMNVLKLEGAKYDIKVNTIAPLARTRMTEELLGPLAEKLDPDKVSPVVAYFASEECAVSGDVWSVGGGSVSRMFVGLTEGWFNSGGAAPTVEEVAAHVDEIRAEDGYSVPQSAQDEFTKLGPKLFG